MENGAELGISRFSRGDVRLEEDIKDAGQVGECLVRRVAWLSAFWAVWESEWWFLRREIRGRSR